MNMIRKTLMLGISLGTCIASMAQQPTIHTQEHITQLGPGVFRTDYCDGMVKRLWADSTAGYTSYLWSTGATTPSIVIPTTMSMQAVDTVTLTVGLPSSGFASSEVYLYPSFFLVQHLSLLPPYHQLCPGAIDFSFLPHSLDSLLTFSNGQSLSPPFDPNCATTNFTLPATVPAGTRYLTNGCVYQFQAPAHLLLPTDVVTITQNGNTFTASHSFYFGPPDQTLYWKNVTGQILGTGPTYTPTSAISFYSFLEIRSFRDLGPAPAPGCVAFNSALCYTNPSDTIHFTPVGVEQPADRDLLVVPNPTDRHFSISHAPSDLEEVEVFSVEGRFLGRIHSGLQGFDASQLAAGLYWLRWETNSEPHMAKLLKQ